MVATVEVDHAAFVGEDRSRLLSVKENLVIDGFPAEVAPGIPQDGFRRLQSVLRDGSIEPADCGKLEEKIQIIDQSLNQIAKRRAALEQASSPDGKGQPVNTVTPFVWLGTGAELGRLILDLLEQKKIRAENKTDAFRQAVGHFVKKDGGTFTLKVLMESERAKRAFEEGKRPKI